MNYEDYKKIADKLAEELDFILTKESVDVLIFKYAHGLAFYCLDSDQDIDQVLAERRLSELDGPFRQRALGLIRAEAWCAYLSYVDGVCD